MKRFLYATIGGKLRAMLDVTDYSVDHIERVVEHNYSLGGVHFISDKGISICSSCKVVLGEKEIAAGDISHGMCPECMKKLYPDLCA